MEPPEPRIPMTTEPHLGLPPDELALLRFLSSVAGDDDAFIARNPDLLAKLTDCSVQRFGLLAKRLTARGLIERRKLVHVGTEWMILAKVDDAPKAEGALFLIPQCRPNWPNVVTWRREALLSIDALPLVSQGASPSKKEPVLRFPRNEQCELVWNITTSDGTPARDCVVHATLYFGRSRYGVGGTPVEGFDGVRLQHTGDGQYTCRIRITAQPGENYVCVIDARRKNGQPFGHWEEPSAISGSGLF
jgi:hypothetical protein